MEQEYISEYVTTERDTVRDLMRSSLGKDIYIEMKRDPIQALDDIIDQFIGVIDHLGLFYTLLGTKPTKLINDPDNMPKEPVPPGYATIHTLKKYYGIEPNSFYSWVHRRGHTEKVKKIQRQRGRNGVGNLQNVYPLELVPIYEKEKLDFRKHNRAKKEPKHDNHLTP